MSVSGTETSSMSSTDHPTDFLLIKDHLARPKQPCYSSSLCPPPPPPPPLSSSAPTGKAWETNLGLYMMKLKQRVGGDAARKRQSWHMSYLKVVDFLWSGRPVDLSQRGSADQWGELSVGELLEWLPESGRWFLWPHPHPQSRCQDVLLIGLALHLLHQGLLFLVDLVGLSGWHSVAAGAAAAASAALSQNSWP